ncbi:MAG: NAD-dependent epimerase/dehydratase family protein [Bacteroidales bacterium]
MNILITGAAGFIGMHAAKKLLEAGHHITGIDNLNAYYDPTLKYARLKELGIMRRDINSIKPITSDKFSNFSFLKVDICNNHQLQSVFKSRHFDLVLHLAAQAGVQYSLKDPDSYINANIIGFFQVLNSCDKFGIKHLLFASSSSVYGMNEKIPYSIQDQTDKPASLYAATKKANELMAYAYAHTHHFHVTGLRFFTVYGPWGRPDMAPYIFTDSILHDRPIHLNNHGDMWRDFTYIDDIVEGIKSITQKKVTSDIPLYRIYNIGNSKPICVNDLVHLIETITNKNADKIYKPLPVGDVLRTFAEISPLKDEFGFEPKTDLEEGMRNFIKWYQAYSRD